MKKTIRVKKLAMLAASLCLMSLPPKILASTQDLEVCSGDFDTCMKYLDQIDGILDDETVKNQAREILKNRFTYIYSKDQEEKKKAKVKLKKVAPQLLSGNITQVISTQASSVSKSSTDSTNSSEGGIDLATGLSNKKLSFNAYAQASSNLYEPSSVNSEASAFAQLGIQYRLKDGYIIRGNVSGTKDFKGFREQELTSLSVILTKLRAYTIGKAFGNINLIGIRNLDDTSRKANFKEGSVGIGTSLIAPVNNSLTMIFSPNIMRGIYKFKQSRSGQVNNEWTATARLTGLYSFNDKWSLVLMGVANKNWNFEGTNSPVAYSLVQELSYSVSRNFILGFGHTNGGSLVDNQIGQDSELELFKDDTSTLYLSTTYTF